MTDASQFAGFIQMLNEASIQHEDPIAGDCKVSRVVSRYCLAPEAFAIVVSAHTGLEEEEVLADRFDPDETMTELFARYTELGRRPRRGNKR